VALEYENYIQTHEEMAPILSTALDSSAWVIIMYHNIGIPGGWGYYQSGDFQRDLDQIAAEDFWCANFDMAAAYIQEKNHFQFEYYPINSKFGNWKYNFVFRDNLDNEVFDQPLSFEFLFNPELNIKTMEIDPPINSTKQFQVRDHKLLIDLIPDDRVYKISIRN